MNLVGCVMSVGWSVGSSVILVFIHCVHYFISAFGELSICPSILSLMRSSIVSCIHLVMHVCTGVFVHVRIHWFTRSVTHSHIVRRAFFIHTPILLMHPLVPLIPLMLPIPLVPVTTLIPHMSSFILVFCHSFSQPVLRFTPFPCFAISS